MYGVPRKPPFPWRRWLTLIAVIVLVYLAGSWLFKALGFGGSVERYPATVTVEEQGIVSVTLEGEESKRAENGMKLFPDESISTGPTGNAALTFFDGTQTRLDHQSDLSIVKSNRGEEESAIDLSLSQGQLWILTPSVRTFTGAITRTVHTPLLSLSIPSGTELSVGPRTITVYAADGAGVTVSAEDRDPVVVGEGQTFSVPDNVTTLDDDLYAYRTATKIGPTPDFILDSREMIGMRTAPGIRTGSGETLSVTSPVSGSEATGTTVVVRGSVNSTVDSVTVNGYPAVLDELSRTFSQEIALPANSTEDFIVRIQALSEEGDVLDEEQRSVKRKSATAPTTESPTVTQPAKTGETYRTNATEIVVRGTSPRGAVAIYVNDYKLQLFDPAKGTWSYLATVALGNLKPGTNTYDVVSEDASGLKSAPARLTIVYGEDQQPGVVPSSSAGGATSSMASKPVVDPSTLPKNDPLTPGVIELRGDAAKEGFTATGTGFLLEGVTSTATASVWVNDYQLQLFKAGNRYWNYLANAQIGTLKAGSNTFKIVARNEKGEILDIKEYTVTYTP